MKSKINQYWDSLSYSKQDELIKKYSIRVHNFISYEAKEFIYNRENN